MVATTGSHHHSHGDPTTPYPTIGLIGLGYVGLPVATAFAAAGSSVVAFDTGANKIAALTNSKSYIEDVADETLATLAPKLNPTTDPAALATCDAIVIAVPTPLTASPGTSQPRPASPPGTDYHLAFSPERIDPGREAKAMRTTPKLVGGITPECTAKASRLYGSICDTIVQLSCPEAAETKPFGFMRFEPGPGMGGHCLPVDPFYLAFKAREHDFYPEFIELAGKVNQAQPRYCVERIEEKLNEQSKSVKNSKVLLMGLREPERPRRAKEPSRPGADPTQQRCGC